MWKDRTSIQTKFMRNMISIALTSIGLWCLIWIHGEYSAFRTESELLRAEYIESQKKMLKSEVAGVVKYVKFMKDQAYQQLKLGLKERVDEAHQIALNIYRENRGSKTPAEIGKMVKDALRPIRFNSGRGYYFAVSMDGTEMLYPIRPEFEGKRLIDLQDSKGNFVIQDEINIINKSREGFVKHYWTKPDKDTAVLFPKISFVKYFKPLDWYFGTGEYLEDANNQLQIEVLNRLADLRFESEGYFFGSTFKGESLFSAGKVTLGAGNIWGLTDPNGVKIIQAQRKAVENPEGGFVSYVWKKLNAPIPTPKISYVFGIPEWQWTIGAGVYLDTIENTISKRREALEISLRKKIINSMFILVVLLLLIYFWSKRISKQLANAIETFSLSLKKSTTDELMVDPVDIHLREFKDIAILTNEMLEDRKKATQALRESEEKYRLLVEYASDAIFIAQDESVKFPNPKALELLGYSEKELTRMPFVNLIHPEDRHMIQENYKRSLTAESFPGSYSFRAVHKKGQHLIVQINSTSIIWEGKPATLNFVRDITSNKKMEEKLRQSQKMEAIGTLAGGIAHDFNNILSGIFGYAQLLQLKIQKDSDLHVYVDSILKAGNRAKKLVKQILTFSRQSSPELRPVEIQLIAGEALKLLESTLPSTIVIRKNIQSNCGMVLADQTELHQIIMNLCTNAYHAMEGTGGELSVHLREVEYTANGIQGKTMNPGKYALLTVGDTGIGMDQNVMPLIFDPYFTTKEEGKGTGMGLAVIHGIVKSHHGYVTVESEIGKGTEFHIHLPVIEDVRELAGTKAALLIQKGHEQILLIDDQKDVLDIEQQMLEALGYQVTAKTGSADALDTFRRNPDDFDLVVTDMTMPNMTGEKLAMALIEIRPDIPIILCTGLSEGMSKESAAAYGIKALLMKPIVLEDLSKLIRKVLDK